MKNIKLFLNEYLIFYMNFNHFEKYLENFFNRPKIKDSKRGSVISKTEFGRKSFPFWKKKSVQILTTTHQRGCFSRRKTHNSENFFVNI